MGTSDEERLDHDSLSLDDLARLHGVEPVRSVADMACAGIFESDEELEEFIAYTYAARRRDVA